MCRALPTSNLSAASSPAKVERSRDIPAAQIHVLETGPRHVNSAIDFSPEQPQVALEVRAIGQGQIALGMQTIGGEGALHQRPIEHDRAVCPRVAQVDRAFDPTVEDFDRPNELRAFKIDIPHAPGAGDPDSRERHRLPPWRPRQQVFHKAGRELAAIVLPVCVLLILGIQLGRATVLVEVRNVALFDLGPSPTLGGLNIAVGCLCQRQVERAHPQPKPQRTQKRQQIPARQ
jgi:hypothetical protein